MMRAGSRGRRARYSFAVRSVASLLVAFLTVSGLSHRAHATEVTVKPETTYQTILGWGATSWIANVDEMRPVALEQLLDMAVSDLGLTRLRYETPRRQWEDVVNDDDDPFHIDWAAFHTEEVDKRLGRIILPFKQRVEAGGEHFCLYVSPSFFDGGSTGSAPAWMLNNPEEYAEWATAFLLYLQKHKLVPDYYSICNEAGNNNAFTPEVVGKMIKALGPRMRQLGFDTKIQFPESINSATAVRDLEALKDDPEVWKYVGLISYHLYGDNSQRPAILQFARAKGLPTAQTEYMQATVNHLYEDLTLGGASYWEQYVISGGGGKGSYFFTAPDGASFSTAPDYWNYRQIMHYVRPGAVRVETACDEPELRTLAFAHKGKLTLVLLNNQKPQQRTVTVKGLPAGPYGLCQSPFMAGSYVELGIQNVDADKPLPLDLAANAILTVYPYPGTNQAPLITSCLAKPRFLSAPATEAELIATATDPEKDELAYAWSVVAQPAGGRASLDAPNAATAVAKGLTAPGDYQFRVTVSDGAHAVSRDVVLAAYAENQPPRIGDLHNRKPVTVMLPAAHTELRGGGQDLEGDPLTFQWTVVRQPEGADAVLTAPTKQQCPVNGLTVAGEYVFAFEVRDPTHAVSKELAVRVYPAGTK